MSYTTEKGRDFWYDFDNQTLFRRTGEITDALVRAYFSNGLTFDSVMDSLRQSLPTPTHPESFLATVGVGRDGFLDLGRIQHSIMLEHLDNPDGIQAAFEDFGQGVLFDDRPPRPVGRHIHMMDGTPDTWVGFHRWHAFARAMVLLTRSDDPWLQINRCIALAWAIQTEAEPTPSNPNNPRLPDSQLADLRNAWMAMTPERLDWAFVSHRFRAPSLSVIEGLAWDETEGQRYKKVQKLLGDAAGTLVPFHDGHGRFWELPYADFMSLPPIYGTQLIAGEGPGRGGRSGLIMALRGEIPSMPQMPLNRPPMEEGDIELIESWIDDGCPED